eukprot:ctg_2412.g449
MSPLEGTANRIVLRSTLSGALFGMIVSSRGGSSSSRHRGRRTRRRRAHRHRGREIRSQACEPGISELLCSLPALPFGAFKLDTNVMAVYSMRRCSLSPVRCNADVPAARFPSRTPPPRRPVTRAARDDPTRRATRMRAAVVVKWVMVERRDRVSPVASSHVGRPERVPQRGGGAAGGDRAEHSPTALFTSGLLV